jgi:signal transduction histidine kinase
MTTPPPTTSRGQAGIGLGARLFAATGLVVVAGAVTLLAVALLVAPQVFHTHLQMALGTVSADTSRHVDQAFTRAVLLSLIMAVVVATLAALAVAWLVSRRIAAPVSDLAMAAGRLAAGGYDVRVPDPGLGPEFTALANGFNEMAARLAATENIRQRMLADLAHEMRTPVASIGATIEAVTDGILPADSSTFTTLTDQTSRLARLVADVAAVSHAEERALYLDPIPRPLNEVAIAATAAIHARYTTKGVRLAQDCAPGTPNVAADADRLGEAVGNLLDNALRHTPPGGTVTVTTRPGSLLGHPIAVLTVTDTGDGFDPADADRLFERFYRGDTARTRHDAGSGIGLTISRAIVTAHGGSLRASSPGPGHGATFQITLPAAA